MGKKGFGSYRVRSDGRGEWRFVAGYDRKTGKPKMVYVTQRKGETKTDLNKRYRKVKAEYEAKLKRPPSSDTVASFSKEWMQDFVIPNKKPNTVSDYQFILEKEILPYFGKKKLHSIEKSDVQQWVNMLRERPSHRKGDHGQTISAKTVKNIHAVFSSIMNYAVKVDKIAINPAANIILPTSQKPKLKTMPLNEIKNFMDLVDNDAYKYPILLALWTGMRQSEILGLTWDDIDFEKKIIHVRHQLQRQKKDGSYIFLDTTKNGEIRDIPASGIVFDWLREIREIQKKNKEFIGDDLWIDNYNLVFTDAMGKHYCHRTIRNHFKKIVNELGYPELRFHDLRHTFASLIAFSNQGQPTGPTMDALKDAMGHYSIWFTYDTYASLFDEQKEAFAETTQRAFEKAMDLPQETAPKSTTET